MYGLVNLAVRDLIVTNFGADKWEEVKRRAGFSPDTFNRMEAYPDDLTYRLVGAVSEVLGISPDQALTAFGEFWVLYTGREGYGHLFDIAGTSLKDFLHNLDNLHSRVGQNFSQLVPPSFVAEDLDERTVKMHYYTQRAGLCAMVVGLLTGLGKHFKTDVTVEQPACVRDGHEHCEFVVHMQGESKQA
jgi:predicted hydrocarbon binding protein